MIVYTARKKVWSGGFSHFQKKASARNECILQTRQPAGSGPVFRRAPMATESQLKQNDISEWVTVATLQRFRPRCQSQAFLLSTFSTPPWSGSAFSRGLSSHFPLCCLWRRWSSHTPFSKRKPQMATILKATWSWSGAIHSILFSVEEMLQVPTYS